MRNKLHISVALLLFISAFTACKKEPAPLRESLLGKWRVDRIEVTTYSTNGSLSTTTTNYGPSDYFEFKDNQDDDFILGLGNSSTVGSYSSMMSEKFFLDFTTKDLDCDVIVANGTQLQFVGTVTGANPKVTETYYLSR